VADFLTGKTQVRKARRENALVREFLPETPI
jgi:hypothetical protein